MVSDAEMLDACPDYVSVSAMLKAFPADENGRRVLYFEASNEGLDQQGEVIAAKALADSADYYKRYGNVDIDHYTQIGAKLGIPNYPLYEIGRPVEVGQRGKSTFVKAELFTGEGPAAEHANIVWSSMTEITPPQRWYPSVGGQVSKPDKAIEIDPKSGDRRVVIKRVRWTNVGLSKTPVNQHVDACATIPMGTFAKCWTAAGLDFSKAMEAGYGTDSAAFTGAAAMREQSLDGAVHSYFDFRERLAGAMRRRELGDNPKPGELIAFSTKRYGLSTGEAAEHVERFVGDLRTGLQKRKIAS